jgi:hypothetical protein
VKEGDEIFVWRCEIRKVQWAIAGCEDDREAANQAVSRSWKRQVNRCSSRVSAKECSPTNLLIIAG